MKKTLIRLGMLVFYLSLLAGLLAGGWNANLAAFLALVTGLIATGSIAVTAANEPLKYYRSADVSLLIHIALGILILAMAAQGFIFIAVMCSAMLAYLWAASKSLKAAKTAHDLKEAVRNDNDLKSVKARAAEFNSNSVH